MSAEMIRNIRDAAASVDDYQLLDREVEPIEDIFGCNCDLDAPCSVAECQMDRDFEMRRMLGWYRNQIARGCNPVDQFPDRLHATSYRGQS